MFSINIYLKFALIAVFLLGGVVLSFIISLWYAIPLILIGLGFLASYIFLGTVQTAAEIMQAGDYEATEKRLNLTIMPDWLYVTNRAFYYIIKGSLALNRKDNETAEALFQKAKNMKLPSDNERAMVLMQLANMAAMKNNWNQAQAYYRELKKLNVTEGMIKEQLAQFDKTMSQQGQIKSSGRLSRQMGGFRPGGKRRRPKMR